jgi:hypothetical protein
MSGQSLPAMHFLTGYDTTNVLFKIGKKKPAYNVLLKNLETFKELGKLNSMTMSEAVKISTKFALAF